MAGVPTRHFRIIFILGNMGNSFKYEGERKSHQSLKEIYFWTSVIKDWKHLLKTDEMKMIIIGSFQ